MPKAIVLCRTINEYNAYIDDTGHDPKEYVYGASYDHIAGIEVDEVIIYGTFYQRHNAVELERRALLQIRK